MSEATLQKALAPTSKATANLFPVELHWVSMSHFLTRLVLQMYSVLDPGLIHRLGLLPLPYSDVHPGSITPYISAVVPWHFIGGRNKEEDLE